MGRKEVKVGWFPPKASAKTIEIATINTLGAPAANIPARDAISPVVRGNKQTIVGFNSKAVHLANQDKDSTPALESLAGFLDTEVTQSVRNFSTPGNAESTIASKGKDDPLVGAGAGGGRLVAEVGAALVKRRG